MVGPAVIFQVPSWVTFTLRVMVTPLTGTPWVRVPLIVLAAQGAPPREEASAVPPVDGFIPEVHCHCGAAGVPVLTCRQLGVILNNTRPVAGFAIALRCAVVIRGGKKPLVLLSTSSCALA